MKLTRSLVITPLAFSALAQAQVKNNEAAPSTAIRTARIIQAPPEMNQLNELVRNQSDASKIRPIRQVIVEKDLAASLEVDATIAQIDNEIAQSNEVRGYLSDRRDKAVYRANLLSIVSGGILGCNQCRASVAFRRTKLRLPSASPPVCSPPLWRSPVFGRKERRNYAFRLPLQYVGRAPRPPKNSASIARKANGAGIWMAPVKNDYAMTGKGQFTPDEKNGYVLFRSNATQCNECHRDGGPGEEPLFTGFTASNLGLPPNPAIPFCEETTADRFGYASNPLGLNFLDPGVGGFLKAPWTRIARGRRVLLHLSANTKLPPYPT
jgi:hypothetical protein